MGRFRDKIYPYVVGAIVMIIAYCFHLDPTIKGFDNVLDGLISFSSIVLGFVAALLAIILSISKSPVMNHLYNYTASGGTIDGKTLLFGYFRSALFSGFFTVIISIYMFIISNKERINIFDEILTYFWIGITTIFMLTSYRIVSIIMFTLFKHESNQSTHEQATQPESDYSQLQERNTRVIE
ncbi:hypothetical protein [Bacillus sp. FJAT-29814]|uniref:hypothetical protein n=1 Tax=Bacillus sp. FJAT-29814 TaxID=1729688 RepID=UPI00082D6654|nr:hypothetical protein [Bacillus sp. FJAT-29814]